MNPDFLDMLSALSAEDVEFLLVGAYALSVHGHPRATGDLDLWVRNHPVNASRVYRALAKFGAPIGKLKESDFCNDDLVFQIGVVPNRIDILTHVDGLNFEEAWKDREKVEIEGQQIPVISKANLIRNKRATGRARDRLDAQMLEDDQ